LRAVQSYLQLQEQLTACEDKLEFARRYYNTSTRDYDNALQVFPGNLVARPFSFVPALYFEAAAEDRSVPRVVFPGSDTVARPTG
jgi:LemA protein